MRYPIVRSNSKLSFGPRGYTPATMFPNDTVRLSLEGREKGTEGVSLHPQTSS